MGLRPSQRVILSQTVGYAPGTDAAPVEAEPEESASGAGALRDGIWEGRAEGYDGGIVVEIGVQAGRIAAVGIVREQESAPGRSYDVLPSQIIEAQGVEGVDTVTGATVTSRAVLDAVGQAIEKAR